MDICFVPSLEHLACAKIVTLLLNDSDVDLRHGSKEEVHDWNTLKVKDIISKLIPCNRLIAKLENFITPILCEVTNWLQYCQENTINLDVGRLPVNDIVRQCWLSDGTIDREKSARIFVKNSDVRILDRFVFACNNCMSEDILNLWGMLYKIEKAYFRRTHSIIDDPESPIMDEPDPIIRRWIEWLENSTNKDWESCTAWILETPLWKSNLYILKRVFQTMSPIEKSEHLLRALLDEQVSSDVMRFGLQIMSREERAVLFRKPPVKVFECLLSWPLRGVFMDQVDNLWPYITPRTFCRILDTILSMIEEGERDHIDLLEILKSFWAQSPSHCKKAAEKVKAISRPLNFVLNYDFVKKISRRRFLNSFKSQYKRTTKTRTSRAYKRTTVTRTSPCKLPRSLPIEISKKFFQKELFFGRTDLDED